MRVALLRLGQERVKLISAIPTCETCPMWTSARAEASVQEDLIKPHRTTQRWYPYPLPFHTSLIPRPCTFPFLPPLHPSSLPSLPPCPHTLYKTSFSSCLSCLSYPSLPPLPCLPCLPFLPLSILREKLVQHYSSFLFKNTHFQGFSILKFCRKVFCHGFFKNHCFLCFFPFSLDCLTFWCFLIFIFFTVSSTFSSTFSFFFTFHLFFTLYIFDSVPFFSF